MRSLLASLLFLLLLPCSVLAWEGKVLSVHDGDSITVQRMDSDEKIKIRLYGIDAPELPGGGKDGKWMAQPYSKKSRDLVRSLLPDGSKVSVVDMGFDKYSRTLAGVVSLPDGKVVQEELLRTGLAWVYTQYCKNCDQWKTLEAEARESKCGLWWMKDAVPPWEWRHPKN